MIGKTNIQNLKIQCIIGIHPHERTKEQLLFVDVAFDYDFEKASISEDVNDVIDYTSVAKHIEQLLIEEQYQLIETAAEKIAALLFHKWESILQCSIHIKKPNAIPNADFASVKICRKALGNKHN